MWGGIGSAVGGVVATTFVQWRASRSLGARLCSGGLVEADEAIQALLDISSERVGIRESLEGGSQTGADRAVDHVVPCQLRTAPQLAATLLQIEEGLGLEQAE